jgi:hypothetical protein
MLRYRKPEILNYCVEEAKGAKYHVKEAQSEPSVKTFQTSSYEKIKVFSFFGFLGVFVSHQFFFKGVEHRRETFRTLKVSNKTS